MGEREAQKSRFCLSSLVLLKLIEPLGGEVLGECQLLSAFSFWSPNRDRSVCWLGDVKHVSVGPLGACGRAGSHIYVVICFLIRADIS